MNELKIIEAALQYRASLSKLVLQCGGVCYKVKDAEKIPTLLGGLQNDFAD